MRRDPGIYVEIFIRGTIDDVWRLTQDPALHERWDLRFSTIRYLPRESPHTPQRFLYSTRIGGGVTIAGEGESVGEHLSDGARTSALKFWSDDPRSLIRQGSGYWQYLPRDGGVIFLTWYDYTTRFGAIGTLLDRWFFRPALGWATAWSFDRLRLWIERGVDPAVAMQRSVLHAIARCTVGFVFVWHGLIPKLVYRHPDELVILTDAGISNGTARVLVSVAGVLEVLLGLSIAFFWSRRAPLVIALALMVAATIAVALTSPRYLAAAFNPVTLNLSVFVLAAVALLTIDDRPMASRCCAVEGGSVSRSIYEEALGTEYQKLHPQIQRRFGFSSADGVAAIGTGVMDTLWHGPLYTLPFLYVGTFRRIMFPEHGQNVPFTIENYAYVDPFGRETVTWIRTFRTRRLRRFDAYMINSAARGRIVDYLGSHEHPAVDIDLSVDERGGLRLKSGAQRFYEGPIAFTFPMLFSGIADVCEWYDDRTGRFQIEVNVHNRWWGPLFGYRGWFDVEWRTVAPGSVPDHVKPVRHERRE